MKSDYGSVPSSTMPLQKVISKSTGNPRCDKIRSSTYNLFYVTV